MDNNDPRFWELFFEVYEHLPRGGPGSTECTRQALALCRDLNDHPEILDLGSGPGAQSLALAELTNGRVLALDNHPPFITTFNDRVRSLGLEERVRGVVGDMGDLELEDGSFDLVWSEGAAYFLGFENACRQWKRLLKPGGYLAVSEACFLVDDPGPEVQAFWDAEYPEIGPVAQVLGQVEQAGYEICGHFILPPEAWLEDFYNPMQVRITELKARYRDDAAALEILCHLEDEIQVYKKYRDRFSYLFVVGRVR